MAEIVLPVATKNRHVSIVVLTKYKDIFNDFYKSKLFYELSRDLIIVRDGSEVPDNFAYGPMLPRNEKIIQGNTKFSMAGNGNIGLKAVPKEHDILYVGDDIRFLEHSTIDRLQEIAYEHPDVGILSPRLLGRGSTAQRNPEEFAYVPPLLMWFPCVYIKREVIDKIGYLDEQFSDFGCDDFDYCIRTLLAGYKLAVTGKVTVEHKDTNGGPTTFVRNLGIETWRAQELMAQQKVCAKYKINYNEFQALAKGDLSVLKDKEKQQVSASEEYVGLACSQKEAPEYLKKQGLFIATPVYGGNSLTVNYINSLLGLVNLCRDLGIPFQISFMYNESLITRARNIMVKDFLATQNTHFLFIDCDISFNPYDIILMMMQKEEVIGAPCVKKGLRWDRIINAIENNPKKKQYTGTDLEKITGQYVVNFLKDKTPASFDLGKLLEVRSVGTGLMMVKRHVFERISEKVKDRWYVMPLDETDAKVPIYMYFQAGLDYESRELNPTGLPDYASEDYGFCQLCREVGVRVWLAPWLKTEHFGTYLFHGDLKSVADSGGGLR